MTCGPFVIEHQPASVSVSQRRSMRFGRLSHNSRHASSVVTTCHASQVAATMILRASGLQPPPENSGPPCAVGLAEATGAPNLKTDPFPHRSPGRSVAAKLGGEPGSRGPSLGRHRYRVRGTRVWRRSGYWTTTGHRETRDPILTTTAKCRRQRADWTHGR